jgi:peptidoglycan hydrolase-like protein with peptidoglycan-binding domain
MKKYFAKALLVSICFSFSALLVSAQVSEDVKGDVSPDTSNEQCTELSYNLTYRKSRDFNTNNEVSDLQAFLQDQGLLTGEPTGNFGVLTFRAVKSFQAKSGLLSSGYVGPLTRAKIKEISCSKIDSVGVVPAGIPTIKVTSVSVPYVYVTYVDLPRSEIDIVSVSTGVSVHNQGLTNGGAGTASINFVGNAPGSKDLPSGYYYIKVLGMTDNGGEITRSSQFYVGGKDTSPSVSLATPTLVSSSPISQYVVGGTIFNIATFRLATAAAGTQATIRELRFKTTGADAIESVTVNGKTSPAINGGTTIISGLSIPVTSNGTDVSVTVKFAGFQNSTTGGSLVASDPNVALALSGVEALTSSGNVITSSASVSSNNFTLVASKPTVTVGTGSGVTGTLGKESKIGEFTVSADANGKVSVSSASLSVLAAGITSVTYASPRLANGSVTIPGSSVVISGNIASLKFSSPFVIMAGQSTTFSLFATVAGTLQGPTSAYIVSSLTPPSSFIWKDVIGGDVSQNGEMVTNFPTVNYRVELSSSVVAQEAVGYGVYEGGPIGSRNHEEQSVYLQIPSSAQGKVLVLTAYEPVNWILRNPNGITPSKIITAGYYAQRVTSADGKKLPTIEYNSYSLNGVAKFAYKTTDSYFSDFSAWLGTKGVILSAANFIGTYSAKDNQLFASPTTADTNVVDIYKAYLNGQTTPSVATANVSKAYALENCMLNHNNNPTKSISCTWGASEIYTFKAPVVTTPTVTLDTYKAYFDGLTTPFINSSSISKADALAHCTLSHTSNPTKSISCTWGLAEIYTFKAPVVTTPVPAAPIPVKWGPQSNTPFNAGPSSANYSIGSQCYKWTTNECKGTEMTSGGACAPGLKYSTDFTTTPCSSAIPTTGSVLGASTFSTSCVNIPRNLHRGAESGYVTIIQGFLFDKGYLNDAPTGFYGDKTIEAVKRYQKTLGLKETGMVYDFTRQAIKEETCK